MAQEMAALNPLSPAPTTITCKVEDGVLEDDIADGKYACRTALWTDNGSYLLPLMMYNNV
jgi:hypothetical protein